MGGLVNLAGSLVHRNRTGGLVIREVYEVRRFRSDDQGILGDFAVPKTEQSLSFCIIVDVYKKIRNLQQKKFNENIYKQIQIAYTCPNNAGQQSHDC